MREGRRHRLEMRCVVDGERHRDSDVATTSTDAVAFKYLE
jgi:hypothetical protein